MLKRSAVHTFEDNPVLHKRAPRALSFLSALAVLVACLGASAARADVTFNLSAFTGLPKIVGGCLLSDGRFATGIFIMQGRTAIASQALGLPGLTDNQIFKLGAGNDSFWVANQVTSGSSTPVNGCSQFGPPLTNGFAIAIQGEGGNDTLTGGQLAVVQGGPGNDTVFAGDSNANSVFTGDDGDDVLWTAQRSVSEVLSAGNGNDTLCKSSGDTGVQAASGGAGTDCANFNFGNNIGIETTNVGGDCNGRCSVVR